jgi:hypothetical protein
MLCSLDAGSVGEFPPGNNNLCHEDPTVYVDAVRFHNLLNGNIH